MRLEDMPVTERLAPAILRKAGFKRIYWISLIKWTCCYDFVAVRNEKKYLIEVKPSMAYVSKGKIRRLKELADLGNNVVLLIIDVPRGNYYFLPLSECESRDVKSRDVKMLVTVSKRGRICIPKEVRMRFGLTPGTTLKFIAISDEEQEVMTLRKV